MPTLQTVHEETRRVRTPRRALPRGLPSAWLPAWIPHMEGRQGCACPGGAGVDGERTGALVAGEVSALRCGLGGCAHFSASREGYTKVYILL